MVSKFLLSQRIDMACETLLEGLVASIGRPRNPGCGCGRFASRRCAT